MDLGSTLAVFFTVAVALMLAFCLLLKYYRYRLRRERREVVNVDAMNDSVYRDSEEIVEGAYEEFRQRRELKRMSEMREMSLLEDRIIQNLEIRQALDITNNIYGISKVRQGLNNDVPPLEAETTRSLVSIKSFNISRLNTQESDKERAFYDYVHKIVGYSECGLKVVELAVRGIRKADSGYELVKEQDQSFIQEPALGNFCDQLDAYGFYPLGFGYCKFVHTVDVTDLRDGETTPLKRLRVLSRQEKISKEEFQELREEMHAQRK